MATYDPHSFKHNSGSMTPDQINRRYYWMSAAEKYHEWYLGEITARYWFETYQMHGNGD